jgi:hypothetical protein
MKIETWRMIFNAGMWWTLVVVLVVLIFTIQEYKRCSGYICSRCPNVSILPKDILKRLNVTTNESLSIVNDSYT